MRALQHSSQVVAEGSDRRRCLRNLAGLGLAAVMMRPAWSATIAPLSIGTTPVFLDDEVAFLHEWQDYLQRQLERPVTFVQRGSYREITELLAGEKLDAAWVCGYPYMHFHDRMRLLAVPTYQGEPLYRSYVIVPSDDKTTQSIADLGDRIYAFSDPDSNSGWLVPNADLARIGKDPVTFFRKTFFTWAHRRVVDAVAAGVAQAGSVDGYVWETLALHHPELTQKTRVAHRSGLFGFPPLVTRSHLPEADFRQLQNVFVGMRGNAEGLTLLRKLNLDGFQITTDAVFAGIAANMRLLGIGPGDA
jgi:phosphonate transport system substrate-binding protein